jgi:CMP-N-acetylneuraminic acid synthetase
MSVNTDYNIVVLIPIKAHSERISGKNFKLLNGKPLFTYILDTLLSISEITKIVINTDAKELLLEKGLIETNRILIRERKKELLGDFIDINLILKDDMESVPSDFYIMTHTTNPLLSPTTVRKSIETFINRDSAKSDSLFTVNRYQSRFYRKDGTPINHDPNNLIRTQDLDPIFEENSNLYIFTKESFDKNTKRIGDSPILLETPYFESIDIDSPKDWEFADKLLKFELLKIQK